MKNKITKIISLFLVFVLFSFNIDALSRPSDEAARIPSKIPEAGAKLYATVQTKFDFSKIKFSNGEEELPGYDSMRKIVFSNGFEFDNGKFGVKDDWFTAYCLDGRLKYPENGYYFKQVTGASDAEVIAQDMVRTALLNQSNSSEKMYNLLKQARYTEGIVVSYKKPNKDSGDEMTEEEFAAAMLASSTKTMEVEIEGVTIVKLDGNHIVISATELNEAAGKTGETFKINVSSSVQDSNIIFNRYETSTLDKTVNYNRALWVMEHSYPTLDLNDSLQIAGADYDKLKTEIKTLHTDSSNEELEKLVENYVYSTVQYAIWKINDGIDYSGKTLGNTLIGSEELNKLYQYLINDKGNKYYENYASNNYTEKLSIVKPQSKKEIYEETTEIYKYGPYKIEGDFVDTGKIKLSVKNAEKNGVKLVDRDGNEVTEVYSGDEFFVLTNKKSKIANVTVEASADEAKGFASSDVRGRIYYANSVITQNVVTGGKLENKATAQNFELLFNPSTGVENVGILFVITMIAFAIGYFVLNYKNQPVEL